MKPTETEPGPSLPLKMQPATFPRMPRLLVSVRSQEEAAAAWIGGCDILDIKEPNHGSLGMADSSVIGEICRAANSSVANSSVANSTPSPRVISAALGDALDEQRLASLPSEFDQLSFVKMGCAGMADLPQWQETYLNVMRQVQSARTSGPAWMAVAYADWKAARAPSPRDIASLAVKAGLAGVLIDTFTKTGQSLGEWMPPNELAEIAIKVKERGLLWAVAGSLSINDLSMLTIAQPDIIGIRTAACLHGERQGTIDPLAVRRFRSAMHTVWEASC